MPQFDGKSRLDFATSLPPLLRTAGSNGSAVDCSEAYRVAIFVQVGAITDGTHTIKIQESDSSGSGFADVAAGDQLGSFVTLVANTNQVVSYIGSKRYLRAVNASSGSTGGNFGVVMVFSELKRAPASATFP